MIFRRLRRLFKMLLFRSMFQTFLGNSDRGKVVKHKLSVPIKASFVRVLPLTKKGRSALRLELYGCDFFES